MKEAFSLKPLGTQLLTSARLLDLMCLTGSQGSELQTALQTPTSRRGDLSQLPEASKQQVALTDLLRVWGFCVLSSSCAAVYKPNIAGKPNFRTGAILIAGVRRRVLAVLASERMQAIRGSACSVPALHPFHSSSWGEYCSPPCHSLHARGSSGADPTAQMTLATVCSPFLSCLSEIRLVPAVSHVPLGC